MNFENPKTFWLQSESFQSIVESSSPLEHAKLTEMLIKNGASLMIRDNDGKSVLGMSIKGIENGMSTIWLGLREMFSKTMNFVTNPSESIRKTNLRSVNVGPIVRLNFDTRNNID